MDIKTLRKMRGSDFASINKAFDQEGKQGKEEDSRFWKLEVDKVGNGSATIRFLSRVEGDELPWIKVFSHGFKGPTGKWYIEDSRTTIGEPDPVSEYNTKLWDTGLEENKKIAQRQKRKLQYIAWIYVISDPKNPENNGTVRLFKFGKKIMDKIMDKARPTFEDEEPVNVFDLWEGADFKLRRKMVDDYPNYDTSVFEGKSALLGGDEEKLLEVVKQQTPLKEFLDPSRFKSYDELKAKLNRVLATPDISVAKTATEAVSTPKTQEEDVVTYNDDEDDNDETMSFFKKLAAD